MILEMPRVAKCNVSGCAYNSNELCHAKAITIGDVSSPSCDTYFSAESQAAMVKIVAGVGACKVSSCKFNKSYECTVDTVEIGRLGSSIRCLTYQASST
ncbi:DUF1540 domain-containing protein [bacterium]|nr:DUF1540 domain-containing protein [bacterium]